MRYISRNIDRDRFGVVDSETGFEEILTHEDAMFALPHHGEEIKGVTYSGLGGNYCIIVPYQPSDTMSRKQLKTKVIKQVEVRVYKEQITCLYWNPGELKHDVEIRLSDFGKSCAAFIVHTEFSDVAHEVTIVLDKKCKYGRFTFCMPSRSRYLYSCLDRTVKIDIRECGTMTALRLHKWMSWICNPSLLDRLIDLEWRNKLYKRLDIAKTVVCAPFWLTVNLTKLLFKTAVKLFKAVVKLLHRKPKEIIEF